MSRQDNYYEFSTKGTKISDRAKVLHSFNLITEVHAEVNETTIWIYLSFT
jgi:hypothetical protein